MNPHSHHTLTITNSWAIYTPPSTPALVYFKANLKYGYHFVNALVYISKFKDFLTCSVCLTTFPRVL